MYMNRKLVIIASALLSVLIIGGAALAAGLKKKEQLAQPGVVRQRTVSKAELAKADGRNGRDCYVAVDGYVYQIKGFTQWANGKHTPSGGAAYCGADMSQAITKSPHGKQVLDKLIRIGPLKA